MIEKMIYRSDMLRCVLCKDAPCSAACSRMDPARKLRSIWFDNETTAASVLPEENPCLNCPAPCEDACIRSHEVPIRRLMTRLYEEVRPRLEVGMPEDEERLRTELCGIPLENPFLLSSSVVSSTYDMCARAFEAGWAGAAFKTICSMEIHEASPRYSAITGDSGSIVGFKNIEQLSDHSPNMVEEGLGSDIGQASHLVTQYTAAARRGTKKPILAKLTPNVTEMSPSAEAAKRGGADAIAAINAIKSIIGVSPHTYVSSPAVRGMSAVGGYSGNAVKPIALRFIEEMGNNPALAGMHLSAMGGIETWKDALEFILMGASSVQVTTAVMQYGYRIIDDLKSGLNMYLAEKGHQSVSELVGLGLGSVSDSTDVLERDTIVYPKFNLKKCIGCGRCAVSCADGGHQAITLTPERKPRMDASKCVGCHLCVLICPERAITPSGIRVAKRR